MNQKILSTVISCAVLSCCALEGSAGKPGKPGKEEKAFERAAAGNWKEVFSDTCTGDWEDRWFLDGEVGKVKTGKEGMTLTAGPEFKNDAHHMVLWTKAIFKGDLKIEYHYTRLDDEKRCVRRIDSRAIRPGSRKEAPLLTLRDAYGD